VISRAQSTPCLGERVSALADGSLRPDVRDRALAHTLTCPACRAALDVERLTIERLRSLASPRPSAGLMASLYALGEPGGPVPPRYGPGPGMPRPVPVPLGPTYPPRAATSPAGATPVRPGGSSRPKGTAGSIGRRSRTFVVAAGALGVGFVAAGVLTAGAGGAPGPGVRPPVAQLNANLPARQQSGGGQVDAGQAGDLATVSGVGFAPTLPIARFDTASDRFSLPTRRGAVAHQAVVALTRH
jgi:hypothetical protein